MVQGYKTDLGLLKNWPQIMEWPSPQTNVNLPISVNDNYINYKAYQVYGPISIFSKSINETRS